MWHVYALLAQDRIRDRQREAARVALARRAAADGAGSRGQAHRAAIRAGARRPALAAVLRRIEVWAVALAAAARSMAARVEDRAERRVV